MGLDIYKVTYSESWRPSSKFLEWCFDNLPGEEVPSLYSLCDEGMIEQTRGDLKAFNPELANEFEELLKRFGGHDIYIT